MATLTFNLQGYFFQQGLKVLSSSFDVALLALGDEVERAQTEALAYEQNLMADHPWPGKELAAGEVPALEQALNAMRAQAAEDGYVALKKAYVVAFYHHWERAALRWTGQVKAAHDELVGATTALGYPIHERLGAVRDLVNRLCQPKLPAAAAAPNFGG